MAMIIWHTLSALFTIYLNCLFIEGLSTTIDVTVEGDAVLTSGVRQYTVYGKTSSVWSFSVKCSLNTAVAPNEVRLLNNQDNQSAVELTTNERIGRFTSLWSKTFTSGARNPEKYTCNALFAMKSQSRVNENHCYSAIFSEVEIRYVTTDQFTAFSVGLSAYLGEQVSITCKGNYLRPSGEKCQVRRQQQSALIINESLTNIDGQLKTIEYDCGYIYKKCTSLWESRCAWFTCNLHTEVFIWPNLELKLTPSNFSPNVSTLQFNCTSVPPRLMSWTIITDKGDVIDLSLSDDIIRMNVTIIQRPGETILKISEAYVGGTRILLVICSSYDTLAKVSVASHRVFIEECNNCDTFTVEPSTVTVPFAVSVSSTAAGLSTESTIKPTARYFQGITTYSSFHTIEEQTTEGTNLPEDCSKLTVQNFQSSAESMYTTFLLLLVIFLTSFVCILSVVVVILLKQLRLSSFQASPTTCDGNDSTPSETVLHDNPVYVSYSETASSSPDDAVKDDSCVYADI